MNNEVDFKKGWLELNKLILLTLLELIIIYNIFFIKDRMDDITTTFIVAISVTVAMLLILSYLWFKWVKSYKEYRGRS